MWNGEKRPYPGKEIYPNIFREMDSVHIQTVFDELSDRFGFPQKSWQKAWRDVLEMRPVGEDEVAAFLHFGYNRINPILNSILLRGPNHQTFFYLCEYVIKKSPGYIAKMKKDMRFRRS